MQFWGQMFDGTGSAVDCSRSSAACDLRAELPLLALPEISTFTSILAPDRLYPANGISSWSSVYHHDLRTCRRSSFNRLAAVRVPHIFQVTPWAGHLRRNRQPSREASCCMRALSMICFPYKDYTRSRFEMGLYSFSSLPSPHTSRRCCSNHSLLRLF
jgi:hypothetical protein